MSHFRSSWLGTLWIIMMITLIFTGCGKKGDPKETATLQPSPSVFAFTAQQKKPEAVILQWAVKTGQPEMALYRLEKSGLDITSGDCAGCPRTFDVIAEMSVDDPACGKDRPRQCRYTDYNVVAGYHYVYRLSTCDPTGRCERVSAPVEIKF